LRLSKIVTESTRASVFRRVHWEVVQVKKQLFNVFRLSVWDLDVAEVHEFRVTEIFRLSVIKNTRLDEAFADVQSFAVK